MWIEDVKLHNPVYNGQTYLDEDVTICMNERCNIAELDARMPALFSTITILGPRTIRYRDAATLLSGFCHPG